MSFCFTVAILTSNAVGSGTRVPAIWTAVCLTSLTPSIYNNWEKLYIHLDKILWQANQITVLIFYSISFRMVTLLKVTDVPLQVSGIFVITVCFTFFNCFSQIFTRFVPDVSTSFTSYSVQDIYITLVRILQSLTFQPASPKIVNFLHQTTIYDSL